MNLSQENLEKMIGKLIKVIKPNGVSGMEFNLEPIDDNEYYISIQYIVPDGSEYLHYSKTNILDKWNREIKNTIKNYFNADVIINTTSISSESYHNRQKQY
jgi:hypothetical protein